MSMTRRADEGNFIGMGKTSGFILDEDTGEKVPFIRKAGVYFMKMKVPNSYVSRDSPDSATTFAPP